MNRRQKIIVSVTGIFIVLLILVGLTYAYFLTQIQGNENDKSISVTTANLALTYGDGTNQVITAEKIVPGTLIGEKDFTVTNTGNATVKNYRVALEHSILDGIVPSVFKYPGDFQITLTCVSKNAITNEVSGTCNGYTGVWNNESFDMIKNTIDADIRHEYILKIYYNDSGIDQSEDMNKNLNLKVQIYGEVDTATIIGTITNVDTTYAMKLNSDPKISAIKNIGTEENPIYQYKFLGVEVGENHTLTLIDKNGNDIMSENITIKRGSQASVDGKIITVKENQSNIFLTTTKGETLTSTISFNPYSDTNTLAYNIINNAMLNKNGTVYLDNPITTPAKETSLYVYKDGIDSATKWAYKSETPSYSYYYTYGDSYEYNEETKTYTLLNKDGSAIKAVKDISSLVGKYVAALNCCSSSTPISGERSALSYIVAVEGSTIYYIALSNGIASNEYYYTYGDTYEFNESTGTYTIKNSDGSALKAVKYNTNYELLKNKYIVSFAGSTSSKAVSGKNKTVIYKISSDSTAETIRYEEVKKDYKSTEKELSKTIDSYGTSYYFRGGVEDNYVLFNNACWRIVRIEGDGSINLTLAGEVGSSATDCSGVTNSSASINSGDNVSYGWKTITDWKGISWTIADYENNAAQEHIGLKKVLDDWFKSKFMSGGKLTTNGEKLKEKEWCLGGSYDYKYHPTTGELLPDNPTSFWIYPSGIRLQKTFTTDLRCGIDENKVISRIGTLSYDEVALAGAKYGNNKFQNTSYYLFQNSKDTGFYTISVATTGGSNSDFNAYVQADGEIGISTVKSIGSTVRPSVSLLPNTKITSGDGTKNNPYVVE